MGPAKSRERSQVREPRVTGRGPEALGDEANVGSWQNLPKIVRQELQCGTGDDFKA